MSKNKCPKSNIKEKSSTNDLTPHKEGKSLSPIINKQEQNNKPIALSPTHSHKRIKEKKSRVWEVDFFRGLAILLVVWDHAMVDLTMFYAGWRVAGIDWLMKWGEFGFQYVYGDLRLFWRPVFLFIFFFVSGISTAFSKNNLIRGLRLLCVSIAVSAFTYLLSNWTGGDYFILLGVLHCMSLIILLYVLISFIIEKLTQLICYITNKHNYQALSKIILTIACLMLSVIFYTIDRKYNITLYELESGKIIISDNKWLGLFFYVENWRSADYFPLFPFISYFFLGAGLMQFLYPRRQTLMPSLDYNWHKPITFFGRYSLITYLLAQVVLFTFFAIITYITAGIFII